MKTPAYLEIKKSKFYSYAFDIQSKEDVLYFDNEVKKLYKKPTHVCYGYVFLKDGVINGGFNDDKEPKGTSGRPIRDLLLMKKITNKVIIVVRYFGGKELGAGGLIRAYSKSASLALDIDGDK
ncbi:hypothetical protein MCSF7_02366 [Mycoplasmopsis columbina SF7]|uniref:Impact N-terminal domain-containing protein n=1 Tax=Mycoplasmopsis columbina SF7 TaxID=1037410 RepID=F9UKR0_9BACT|nr:YigZ family protein [Mycoplasmopsis columbina]EGV00265.1 hypothetical protein MCSF7_02366 [Mycoplasmopsis columbina SF7]